MLFIYQPQRQLQVVIRGRLGRLYLSEESMALINDAVDTGGHAAIESE